MRNFIPYKIKENKLNSLPILDGQIIITTDTNRVYVDDNGERNLINDNMPTVSNIGPIDGFNNAVNMYLYDKNGKVINPLSKSYIVGDEMKNLYLLDWNTSESAIQNINDTVNLIPRFSNMFVWNNNSWPNSFLLRKDNSYSIYYLKEKADWLIEYSSFLVKNISNNIINNSYHQINISSSVVQIVGDSIVNNLDNLQGIVTRDMPIQGWNFLNLDTNYSNIYIPRYNGSPMTKGYFDLYSGQEYSSIDKVRWNKIYLDGSSQISTISSSAENISKLFFTTPNKEVNLLKLENKNVIITNMINSFYRLQNVNYISFNGNLNTSFITNLSGAFLYSSLKSFNCFYELDFPNLKDASHSFGGVDITSLECHNILKKIPEGCDKSSIFMFFNSINVGDTGLVIPSNLHSYTYLSSNWRDAFSWGKSLIGTNKTVITENWNLSNYGITAEDMTGAFEDTPFENYYLQTKGTKIINKIFRQTSAKNITLILNNSFIENSFEAFTSCKAENVNIYTYSQSSTYSLLSSRSNWAKSFYSSRIKNITIEISPNSNISRNWIWSDTNCSNMFKGSYALENLNFLIDLRECDMSYMFAYCNNLKNITTSSNGIFGVHSTYNITPSAKGMFIGCKNISQESWNNLFKRIPTPNEFGDCFTNNFVTYFGINPNNTLMSESLKTNLKSSFYGWTW